MTRFRGHGWRGLRNGSDVGKDSQHSFARVVEAYGSPSTDIEGLLGTSIAPDDPDRAVIEPWADSVAGRILDVGSGTGRWTGHLATMAHTIEGLEPVKRLIGQARDRYPSVAFHQCSIDDLTGSEKQWDGILAWYSLIHLGPRELPQALAVLRSAMAENGSLLMSFFSGPRQEAFNHPVTTAYRWPMTDLVGIVTESGFNVTDQHANPHTPHAYISARAATS